MATIKSSATKNLSEDPNTEILFYSNSQTNAEDPLINLANYLLEKNKKLASPLHLLTP